MRLSNAPAHLWVVLRKLFDGGWQMTPGSLIEQDYDPRWVEAFDMIRDGVFGNVEYFKDLVDSVNDIPNSGNDWFLVRPATLRPHALWQAPRLLATVHPDCLYKSCPTRQVLTVFAGRQRLCQLHGCPGQCQPLQHFLHGLLLRIQDSSMSILQLPQAAEFITLEDVAMLAPCRTAWTSCTQTTTSGPGGRSCTQPPLASSRQTAPSPSMPTRSGT